MNHGNDPESRAEYAERFGEPEQQGIHETYMRPQPCAAPIPDRTSDKASSVEGMVGKLVEMGNLRDGNGDEVVGILIECSKADLQSCDLRMYGHVCISNPEASGPGDKAGFAVTDGCQKIQEEAL